MADNEFEVVERPGNPKRQALLRALIKTAASGKALRFVLEGVTPRVMRNWVCNHAKSQGFDGHCSIKDGHAIAWFARPPSTAKEAIATMPNPDYCPKCGQRIGSTVPHTCPKDKEPVA